MKRITLLTAVSLIMFSACTPKQATVPAIDLTDMDLTVAPGQDFYQYANGGWQVKHPLKPEYARYGSFDALDEMNQQRLNELFQSMTDMKAEAGSVEQKISDLYKQGLDSVRRNAEGFEPLKKYIDRIYAVNDKAGMVALVADLHMSGDEAFFGTGVDSDLTDSNMQVLYMGQGGLGMGDRDYYLDDANAALREGYRKMLVSLFEKAGSEDAQAAADNAFEVESSLAEVSWTKLQNRDMLSLNNPMSTSDICSGFPGFDFAEYFRILGVPEQDKIIVEQPSFFEGFAKYFASADIRKLKDYLAGSVIMGACNSLSDEFYDVYFDFFSTQMSGVTEQKPRWKRAMAIPNRLLGEAVGKMYVEKYFPEENKQRVLELVGNLKTALGQHIEALEWMGDETKAYALEKLANFTVKIGYPDKWKDYSTLEVDPQKSYYENLRAASMWYIADNMSKLGKATDRTEWGMTPQTVNAYYNPTTNEICFPAAILQPPFFNADADDAVNYGAIGVVIGHEMTHGFDDQGRLFDKDGNMASWWTEEDDCSFREITAKLADQFDAVEIQPGLMANGKFTLGENIADQGGLRVAYSALKNALGGEEPEPVDGLTADQRFYLGYAHVWADNITEAERVRRTNMDVHSLGKNRVNVSLKNLQTFFDAFGIKEGDPMYRPEEERVIIW